MSRARLWLSILTCEGLFATLRERLQWSPPPPDYPGVGTGDGQPPALPPYHDYAGALHVHSTYSDGLGSVADVAAAADRAGLDFVALSDHSNLDALTHGEGGWRGRTLVLVGTEITTDRGHLLAMDVPPDLLPLPTDDADHVQQEIQDRGGVGFIALPCDLKDHWRDFEARREGIGLEVFNLSAIARAKISLPGFLLAWATYRSARPQRAFHWVASRPARELRLWDELTATRDAAGAPTRVVGIGSLDAHAVMKVARRKYPIPTYEELFRTLRTHVLTTRALSGGNVPARPTPPDGRADGALIHGALAAGHCYIAYDNYGDSSGFVFEAHAGAENAPAALMGDAVALPSPAEDGVAPTVRLTARAPRTRTLIHLLKDGRRVASARGGRLDYLAAEPGAYRVEVYLYRRRLGRLCLGVKPWVFSNPVYVLPAAVPSARPAAEKYPRQSYQS